MSIEVKDGKVFLATEDKTSTAEVYLYGATVTSWKHHAEEKLFVSSKAHLDGSKAIRGGIPVVWPIFGPPPKDEENLPYHSKLSQHGFARTSTWTVKSEIKEFGIVGVELELKPTKSISSIFPFPFVLRYTVTLDGKSLNVALTVLNTHEENYLKFQALLHSYFTVPSHVDARISDVAGLTYADKLRGGNRFTEDRSVIDVATETDRVYFKTPQELSLLYGEKKEGGLKISVEGFVDTTIWNPDEKTGSAIADMEDRGWEKYVCVEPGFIDTFYTLTPGDEWTGSMTLTAF
ncbi:Uncharacterized enzymes related to aldose 1-epimerase [Phaffia rhodozyma]|uniref:Glucose-6-phosphate 1-epimerase n=1 Tax=Phaffia rhodozyma TaxID=264483 RepID=A0A0F7SFM6_PHARH|nr:Uncharacterized enzymes related to aldose 1-epimerase [Phaffia rhodozyma]